MSHEKITSLSKRVTNMSHKIPYVDIISDAILASPYHRLTAKEIFDYVSTRFGPMKSAETLRNTIRHTLSRYKVFRKVQRGNQKKPNWWTIHDQDKTLENQIQDLQQDVTTTPANLTVPTTVPIQNVQVDARSKRLESSTGGHCNVARLPSQNYTAVQSHPHQFQPVPQHQPVHYVQSRMEKNKHDSMAINGNTKDAADVNTEEYRILQLNDICSAGSSRSCYNFGGPCIGDAATYAHSFHLQELAGPSAAICYDPAYTNTPSPGPQYYQM